MYSIRTEHFADSENVDVEVIPISNTMANMLLDAYNKSGVPEIVIKDSKGDIICTYLGLFDSFDTALMVARG